MRHALFVLFTFTCLGIPPKAVGKGRGRHESILSCSNYPVHRRIPTKCCCFTTLSYNYYPINPDEGIKYGNEGLALANKLKWKFGQAQTNGYLGINYAVKSDYTRSIAHFQAALAAHEELDNKSNVATTLVNLGNIYLLTSDYPHALEYYLRALKIQEEIGYSKGIALSLSNIGLIYKNQSEYAKALEYFLRALEINESGGTKNNIANNLSSIGIVYENQQDYPKALEYFSRALKIQEELKVTDGIAKTLSYIGSVYYHQSDYENALSYLFRSTQLAREVSNELVRGDNQGVIGERSICLWQKTPAKWAAKIFSAIKELHWKRPGSIWIAPLSSSGKWTT